jgi:hypothetical protein
MSSRIPWIVLGSIPIIIGIILIVAAYSFTTAVCISGGGTGICQNGITTMLIPIAYMILGAVIIGIGVLTIYKSL